MITTTTSTADATRLAQIPLVTLKRAGPSIDRVQSKAVARAALEVPASPLSLHEAA